MHECVRCHQYMVDDGIYTVNLCPSCEKKESSEWAEYIRDEEPPMFCDHCDEFDVNLTETEFHGHLCADCLNRICEKCHYTHKLEGDNLCLFCAGDRDRHLYPILYGSGSFEFHTGCLRL